MATSTFNTVIEANIAIAKAEYRSLAIAADDLERTADNLSTIGALGLLCRRNRYDDQAT